MSDKKKVFICYAIEDIEIARRLYHDLKDAGVIPWMAKKDILIGQNWKFEIHQAIKSSPYFLALLSSNSVSKQGYVQNELKMALNILAESPKSKIFLLPLRLDDCPLDEALQEIQWGDLFPSYDEGFGEVLRVLCSNKLDPDVKISFEDIEEIKKKRDKQYENFNEKLKKRLEMLRSVPQMFSEKDVQILVKKHNFFDSYWNESGNFKNLFTNNCDDTVTDQVTGLMWQQSGLDRTTLFTNAQTYIDNLNCSHLSVYNDWRLPTFEELASLFENKITDGLFIDSVFDRKQHWCWSADKCSSRRRWHVCFKVGRITQSRIYDEYYVRAVRSLTIDYQVI